MASVKISRATRNTDCTVGTSVGTSTAIGFDDLATGCVFVSGITASAVLTIHGGTGSTFAPLFDAAGQAVTLTIPAEGGAVSLPEPVFAVRSMKLTASSELGTAAFVVVSLKS